MNIPERYWEDEPGKLMKALGTSPAGLSGAEAEARLKEFGHNLLKKKKKLSAVSLLLGQFKSPIILILLFAVLISAVAGDLIDASIIITIIAASALLSFIQEYSAANASEKLLKVVKTTVEVLRDGGKREVFTDEVVPGDIVLLSAGSIIPADGVLLEARDFFVNESALTGETFPAEKTGGPVKKADSLTERKNAVFMGTSAVSGTATAVIVRTGSATEFGRIAGKLAARPPETDFERGIKRFGYFLMKITLALVAVVFAVNVYFHNPVMDALMFSLALAVGLTPQLLPAIITVNLAKGSQYMSREGVIVKRLASIENFGTMDVLCTDKTGTLTEGVVYIDQYLDINGRSDRKILLHAYLNAYFQTGLKNPIDDAVKGFEKFDISGFSKVDEIAYDFERKRLSVVVKDELKKENILISKGALHNILEVSSSVEADGKSAPIEDRMADIERLYNEWSGSGLRVLGLAYKKAGEKKEYRKEDESEMTFLGFLLFLDPPKGDAKEVISELEDLGIEVKIITGDNRFVSMHTARAVGFPVKGIVTGAALSRMNDEEMKRAVEDTSIFAEADPNQKERIILALKRLGHVVGFMGDGINDAPALHASDVGISVNTAADVAKEAADIVLLEKGLETLRDGVVEGRKTFANTLKYVFMATSANFGNMFSVAGASLFLSFLPMLPKQILLTNLLTDFPEMTIATDSVDRELIDRPRRWDIGFIKRFMIFFGVLSSIFDYVTFGVLLFVLKAGPELFRTGWFVESVLSASFAVTALRTRKSFFRSAPGRYLILTTVLIGFITVSVPYLPFADLLGFLPVSPGFLEAIGLILVAYILLIEAGKKVFYRRYDNA